MGLSRDRAIEVIALEGFRAACWRLTVEAAIAELRREQRRARRKPADQHAALCVRLADGRVRSFREELAVAEGKVERARRRVPGYQPPPMRPAFNLFPHLGSTSRRRRAAQEITAS